MELTLQAFLIVCPLVFLGGFVDSIAGGGGLITLPAYLIAGVPAHMALGTNKLSSATGTTISTLRYIKNGCVDFPLAVPGIIAAFAGAQLGSRTALLVEAGVFKIMLLVALPFIAGYLLFRKELDPNPEDTISRKAQFVIVTLASLVVGFYDGFYGPGTGTFLILAYTSFAKMNAMQAAGNTKLANLTSNISALVTFLTNGTVLIPLGLAASVFSIAGHYLGSGMAIKNGSKLVRKIILVVISILFVKVMYDYFF